MLRKQLIRDATINVSAFIARSSQLFGKIEISSAYFKFSCNACLLSVTCILLYCLKLF